MSHALSTRLSLALLIALCLFGALPALAEDAPGATSPGAGSAQVSLDQFMVPEPELMVGGPSYCAQLNTGYCTYAWSKLTWCCVATYTAPGAFCPKVCI